MNFPLILWENQILQTLEKLFTSNWTSKSNFVAKMNESEKTRFFFFLRNFEKTQYYSNIIIMNFPLILRKNQILKTLEKLITSNQTSNFLWVRFSRNISLPTKEMNLSPEILFYARNLWTIVKFTIFGLFWGWKLFNLFFPGRKQFPEFSLTKPNMRNPLRLFHWN